MTQRYRAVLPAPVLLAVADITCADAYPVAAKYLNGEKYQRTDSFTCYTGTAQTRRTLLQCVSDTAEFAVSTG
jgi:hypothetical protein